MIPSGGTVSGVLVGGALSAWYLLILFMVFIP
jgi:hypothetical protein